MNHQIFKDLMEDGRIYVDKTQILYYTKLRWWKKYCPDFWITQNKPDFFSETPHPIVRFNFYECPNFEGFKDSIVGNLNVAIDLYGLDNNHIDNEKISWSSLIYNRLSEIISALYKKFKKKPIILIDEYDQPLINQVFQLIKNQDNQIKANIQMTV